MNDDIIFGFKAFNKGLYNRYGKKYELNKVYHYEDDLKFGNNGHGFHMCMNLEDVFRFFNEEDGPIEVASVMGWGNRIKEDDEYNGNYDMYVTEYMQIERFFTRKEIIDYMLNVTNIYRLRMFFSLVKLNDEEKEMFKERFKNNYLVIDYLRYYQYGEKDIWDNYYKGMERKK